MIRGNTWRHVKYVGRVPNTLDYNFTWNGLTTQAIYLGESAPPHPRETSHHAMTSHHAIVPAPESAYCLLWLRQTMGTLATSCMTTDLWTLRWGLCSVVGGATPS